MLPMPFVHVITSQLRLQHGPPMLLVQARPRMVRIVMYGNALRSHLRLQLEPPTPLSHRFVNLLGFRLHLLHLQSPSTMPPMMVYSLNGYCPFLPNILQLKLHSPPQTHHIMLEPTLHLHKLCRRHLKMLQLPFHQSCQQHLNVLQLHLHTSLKRHSSLMAGYLSGALIHHHNRFFANYVSSCLRATIVL